MVFGFCDAGFAFPVNDTYSSRAANIYVKRQTYYAEYQVYIYATDVCRQQIMHRHRCAQISNDSAYGAIGRGFVIPLTSSNFFMIEFGPR